MFVQGNIRSRGKTKLSSFPRDQIISALLHIIRLQKTSLFVLHLKWNLFCCLLSSRNDRYSISQGKYPRKRGLLRNDCSVSLPHVSLMSQ